MRSESASREETGARAGKPRPRVTRSKVAKPLLTSLGTFTLLAAGSFVVVGVSATGSMRPWDWAGADPAAAVSRYQACDHQGLGVIGCMLSAGVRPAAAAAVGVRAPAHPMISVETIQDPASPEARDSGAGTATRSAAAATQRPAGTPMPATCPTTAPPTQEREVEDGVCGAPPQGSGDGRGDR